MGNDATESKRSLPGRFTQAVMRLDGDAALLKEMAAMTAPEFPILMGEAHAAIEEGNCDLAIRQLHKLKGMLSTFESDGVVLEIQEMINAGRQNRPDTMRQLLAQQESAIADLIGDIQSFAGV